MNRIVLIARREWKERIRQRSFRVATLINLAVILVAACVPTAIALIQDDEDETRTIAVVDDAGVNAVNQLRPFVSVSTNEDSIDVRSADFTADQAAAQVEEGAVDAVLTIRRNDDGSLAFEYINEDGEVSDTERIIAAGVVSISTTDQLVRAGVPESEVSQAMAAPEFAVVSSSGDAGDAVEDESVTGPELFVAFIIAIVMFMAIQLYGTWIAQGVVEEKQNRIMEIMINAASPRDLLAGKILGIGAAALTQLVPMLVIGGLAFSLQPRIGDALGVDTASVFSGIDFSDLSIRAVGAFLVFFLFGFILFASLYAGVASMLSRQEDINSAVGPLMIFMMIGYIGAFVALPIPDSLFARIISIFPLTSPFTMAGRMVVTDVPAWEIALSVILLVVTATLGVFVASRIYRVGVLMYGQKPSFREVFRNRKILGTSR